MENQPQTTTAKKESPVIRYLRRPPENRLPGWALGFYIGGVLAVLFFILFSVFPAFSDAYNRTVGQFFRMILNFLTAWIPFSVAEAAVLSLPVFFVWFCVHTMHRQLNTWRQSWLYTARILSFIALLFTLMTFVFTPGYKGRPLSDKLEFRTGEITKEKLEATADILRNEIDNLVGTGQILFDEKDFSRHTKTWDELNVRLLTAYKRAAAKYGPISTFPSTVKPLFSSPALMYTHIAGIYTFFTSEVCINANYPDYVRPFATAHEMAHQRGFAKEDEANFIAFLVCAESEDPYIRYSGLMNSYQYILSALYSADPDSFRTQWGELNTYTKKELIAYDKFFQPYEHSVAADIADSVSHVVQSTEGVIPNSYGLVVDLLVAYYDQPGSAS